MLIYKRNEHFYAGTSAAEIKLNKQLQLNDEPEVCSIIQGATSVPLLSVDTVVTVTGSDTAASADTKATTTATTGHHIRKIHKSGDDEGDGVKSISFQRPQYFRTTSRRSLQLIRGPSR